MIDWRTGLLLLVALGFSGTTAVWANGADTARSITWLNVSPEVGAHCVDQATDAFLESLNGRMRLLACQYDGVLLQSRTAFTNGSARAGSTHWVSTINASTVKGEPDAIDLLIRFKLDQGKAQSAGVAVAFDFSDWRAENYVLLPAAVYNGNRCKIVNRGYAQGLDRKYLYQKHIPLMSVPIPCLASTAGEDSRLNLNACNLSTPAICFYSKHRQRAFILLAEQDSRLGNNGFIVEESADRTHLSLVVSAPGVRERKALFVGFTDSPDRGATIDVGQEIKLHLRLYAFEVNGIPGLLEKLMTVRKQVTGANRPRNLVPLSQVRQWMTQRIDSRFHDGAEHEFYCPENAEWISFGWVGGLMNTFPMLAEGDAMHLDRVTRTFDFAIPRAQGEAGYFHGALDQDGRCFSRDSYPEFPEIALTRKNADLLYWMVKQFMLLRAQGRGEAIKPAWEQNVKRLADAFVATWKQDGQWGSHVNNQTGQVAVYNTSGGVMAIGGLALAAEYYREPAYVKTAKEAAEFYYRRDFVAQGQTTGGCADILQNADSETAAGFMTALITLYETTGDAPWLEKSRNLANLVATWTCSYDYQLPANTELAQLDARLAGVYWASTQNKHGAPGICTSSGDALFKIYRATDDRRYAELLHDIVHAHAESIRPGGFTNERLTYCDADAPSVGNRGNHVTGWNELNGALIALEIPGIYVRTDQNDIYVFDHVEAQVTARNEKGVTLRITNQTEYDASVSIFAESATQTKKPLGDVGFLDWPQVSVKSGETIEHVIPTSLGPARKSDETTYEERPNVVLILSDDHPVSAISAYGSRFVSTPNIDRLASQGVRFDNCFCVNCICGPSRSSILTGKYPHLHGVLDNYHTPNDAHVTYPELFKQAGYQTALVGKTHFGTDTKCIQSMDYFMVSHGAEYHHPKFVEKGRNGPHHYPGYATDIVTDKALRWLDRRNKEKPFLLLVHHSAAHMPFQESDELKDHFAETIFPVPASFNDPAKNQADSPRPLNITIPGGLMKFQGRSAVWGTRAWKSPEGLDDADLKSWVYQRLMRAFMSCVVSLDNNVGRVLDYLEHHNLDDNTIVIYASDQGFFLGEHGWYDKRFMYEESLRMPLIVRGPKITSGQTCKAMVLNVDFAPTLLELAGLSVPADMQGESCVPLVSGTRLENWRTSMYYHYYEDRPDSPLPVKRHYGIRTQTHKLIRFYGQGGDQWELYDLEKDPLEMHDLSDAPPFAELRKSLTAELKRLRGRLRDNTGPTHRPSLK